MPKYKVSYWRKFLMEQEVWANSEDSLKEFNWDVATDEEVVDCTEILAIEEWEELEK